MYLDLIHEGECGFFASAKQVMFANLTLKTKLFVLVTAVVVVLFLTVIAIVSQRSIDMAKKDAFILADEMANKYKFEIQAELQGARVTSETLATVFETLKNNGVTDRTIMNDILKNALQQKEYITAFCIAYEPDALDGKDAHFAGKKPEYDDTGRFAPYWNKLGDHVDVEPLYDIDIADWYIVPKKTRKEYLTNPYPYEVQGNSVMLASIIFPILHKDEFIGIISSDIVLDKLQEMVTKVNSTLSDGYTEIISNSGMIVAHPDKRYLGKDMREVMLSDMLRSEPQLAAPALLYAKVWLKNNPPADPTDKAQAEHYDKLTRYVGELEKYTMNPAAGDPDISLLSPEMAEAMLAADESRLNNAAQVRDSVETGKQHVYNSKSFYTVYMPITFSEATNPWSVAVSVPMSLVFEGANNIRNYVTVVSIVSVCLIAGILYLIAGSIVKPVLVLVGAARTIGDGKFDAHVPQGQGNDEIAILARAFKVMAEKISDLVTRLQTYARELEEKNSNLNSINELLVVARDQAEESSRAKGDFLSNMSHEMRTPLNAVIGMTIIGKSAPDMTKKDHAFQRIEDASTHLMGVINDVLDMSKIEANKLELACVDFDFERMLRNVVNFITFRVDEKKQSFKLSIDKNIPRRLLGDDHRLAQVITNLLSNAVKFTPEQGDIRLDVRLIEENANRCRIRFSVSDTGIGISEDQRAKLFQAFQQADSSTSRDFGGTGLGLSISKRIVELMHGQIWVESDLGQGSTFIATVLLDKGESDRQSVLNPGVNWQNLRILAVDDDPDVLHYFGDIAQNFGIACDVAQSGEEAAELIDQGICHDMYFIDWKMPGMSGIELSQIIKERQTDRSVVIMITSVEWNMIADQAKAAGVDRFLPKPLFASDIADCINECLGCPASEASVSRMADIFPGRCVLLAEDVEINREIVLSLLEPAELTIDCAENGSEAVRLFSENPDRYDIIFMDVQMPGMDGLEATRRIRALDTPKARSIPIIALTANVFREDVERCLSAGMDDHLGKPLDLEMVFAKLRQYFRATKLRLQPDESALP